MNNDLPYFWTAFGLYGLSTASYGGFLASRRPALSKAAALVLALGFAVLTIAQVVRWRLDTHFPISNMHEYLRFLVWTISLVYLGLVVIKMKSSYVGAFVAPVAFAIFVLAAVFPKQVEPQLVPALQSYWIKIHVPSVVLGTGAFATSFSAGLLYLLRAFERGATPPARRRAYARLALGAAVAAAVPSALILALTGYHAPDAVFLVLAFAGLVLLFGYPLFWILAWARAARDDTSGYGGYLFALTTLAFLTAAVVTAVLRAIPHLGFLPAPEKKTILLPYFGSMAVIGLLLLWPLQRFVAAIQSRLPSEDLLDEVGYRSASIGYPIFGIGTAFGAMWAYSAWGRAWGFDPKEVGALIVFLVYSVYMHARLARDWRGRKTAVLAMVGFLCALFTLFGNTFLGGLHSYAG